MARLTAMGTPYFSDTYEDAGREADAITAWRYQNRQCQHFGRPAPALPPMDARTAESMAKAAYDASWAFFGITKCEYRDEVAAIFAACAEYQAAGKKPARIKSELRKLLMERDGTDCWLCTEPLGDDCTIEHKVPRSRGGTWAFGNLALAHRACNHLLGDAPLHVKEAARAGHGSPAERAELERDWNA